jgi:hypothetical protein
MCHCEVGGEVLMSSRYSSRCFPVHFRQATSEGGDRINQRDNTASKFRNLGLLPRGHPNFCQLSAWFESFVGRLLTIVKTRSLSSSSRASGKRDTVSREPVMCQTQP